MNEYGTPRRGESFLCALMAAAALFVAAGMLACGVYFERADYELLEGP